MDKTEFCVQRAWANASLNTPLLIIHYDNNSVRLYVGKSCEFESYGIPVECERGIEDMHDLPYDMPFKWERGIRDMHY